MNLKFDLNKKQRKAVETTEGPVLVLAGAGSGKTRALTYRIAYLIAEGVEPESILTVTFTNKAATDMKRKVKELLEDDKVTDKLWMGTFHSICLRILIKNLDKVGYEDNFLIYDTDESMSIIKKVMSKKSISRNEYEPDMVFNIISNAKMELQSPKQMREENDNEFYKTISTIYEGYESQLKQENAFDFNDLIKKTIELFEEYPEVLKRYQDQFKYVQIDEYQDTNYSQYRLATMLAQPNENIFVVGDDYQSIYAFRGADISNILNFEKDYPDAEVVRLERNYRSSRNIIQASNEVIANNDKQAEKDVWSEKDPKSSIVVCRANNEKAEADFVTSTIETLVRSNQYTYNDIAVLYRCNYQSREFESYLLKKEIPHQIVGNVGFFDRAEIKDVMAITHLIINPNHLPSIIRIANLVSNGIGPSTLNKVYDYAANKDLKMLDVLGVLQKIDGIGPKTHNKIESFYEEFIIPLVNLRDKDMPIHEKLKTAIKNINYFAVLRKQRDNLDDRRGNVNEFLRLAYNYQKKDENRGIVTFSRDIKLMSDQEGLDEDTDSVKLMTVHASKGLEFPVVFMVGMEEDTFPFVLAIQESGEKGIEEERRLCYVGMTRAEERLFLSHRETVSSYQGIQNKKKSRFLEEIPLKYKRNIKKIVSDKHYNNFY